MDRCDVCDGKADSCIDEFGNFTDKTASKFSEFMDHLLDFDEILAVLSLRNGKKKSYLLSHTNLTWINRKFLFVFAFFLD